MDRQEAQTSLDALDVTPPRELRVMTVGQLWFWLILTAVFFCLLWLLGDILMPFVAGAAIAYLLDPLCDRLEKWGLSRLGATLVVCVLFVCVLTIALILVVPLVVQQVTGFLNQVPEIVTSLRGWISRLLFSLDRSLDESLMEHARQAFASVTQSVETLAAAFLTGVITSGLALVDLLTLILVTPVVTFFLLRDWDHMMEKVESWLPRRQVLTLRGLGSEVDQMLAGFIRGQGLVCLCLAVFYSTCLTLVGLNFALAIGITAGFLSFIPFIGTFTGFTLSTTVALVQYDNLLQVGVVILIFLLGEGLEGILTPKLVGDRIRLHPVWVLFGLFAGGALFGFVGVLLAVPVSAIIGVALRFLIGRYKQSAYYHGEPEEGNLPVVEGRMPPRS